MRAAARSRGREAVRGGAEIPTAARSRGKAERANGPDQVYITPALCKAEGRGRARRGQGPVMRITGKRDVQGA